MSDASAETAIVETLVRHLPDEELGPGWNASVPREVLTSALNEILSNVSVGGERLTWREVAERQQTELHRLRRFAETLSDLNRCEHGRHEGDVCSECGGPSLGNPFMAAETSWSGHDGVYRQIGFTLSGTPIVVPDRANAHDPDAWIDNGRVENA